VELNVTNVPIIVGGAVAGVFGIAKDLTVQRGLEEQLRQAQKMEAVGRLAGGVAHDFNNLLMVIQNYGGFVSAELPIESASRSDLDEVLKAADRAADLTQQLLAFSRKQLLKPRRLDANRQVLNVARMLRRVIGEDIILETELEPALWPVYADPGQLEQVLMNLAVNARDAMPEGGTLRLRSANVAIDAERERERSDLVAGHYAALVVEDTGVGIEPGELPRIFEPFYTTKGPGHGTGLGLATVYGIVKQSGGHIHVDSAPGRGSRFTVLLPRREEPGADEATAMTEALPRGTERILVVEDEAPVRRTVCRMLERLGYGVLEAVHGAEAIGLIASSTERIDLVLTDVVMPELHGRALAEWVTESAPRLRVLYMSGYTDDGIVQRGLTRSEISLLQKPFTQGALARAVRECLDGRRPRAVQGV
jgi:nitrogen-specific signal transduction histidine kinase/ActR/RegA family two-component response regulator